MNPVRLGVIPSLLACSVLCFGCASSSTEIWQQQDRVDIKTLAAPTYAEDRSLGHLQVTAREQVQVAVTPSERLYLLHEDTEFAFDWDEFGLVFFGILGSVVSLGITVFLAFYLVDSNDDEKK
ncbi:MAG: hypothetical protein IT464_04215 [Planctomycetes bacterium]|nr:hypothetical protein [Planctomycetota bacterium]